jgi:hypothetical protein
MLLWTEKYTEVSAVKKDTKCKIYKILTRSVVLYGCESWTLTKKEEEKLNIFERKMLSKIYGPSCVNGVWRIKYNDELYNIHKEPSTVKVIKIVRLKWLGYIARMEDNAPCKKITSQPEGSRKKARPKLRWLDSVLKDLKILTVTVWWRTAQDRDLWSKITKEAKAHKGL